MAGTRKRFDEVRIANLIAVAIAMVVAGSRVI